MESEEFAVSLAAKSDPVHVSGKQRWPQPLPLATPEGLEHVLPAMARAGLHAPTFTPEMSQTTSNSRSLRPLTPMPRASLIRHLRYVSPGQPINQDKPCSHQVQSPEGHPEWCTIQT